MKTAPAFVAIVAVAAVAAATSTLRHASAGNGAKPKTIATATQAPPQPMEKVVKSEEEWKNLLDPARFAITRKAGTEAPFGEVYKEFKAQGEGTYFCVCCGNKLFTSKTKFDSGCGWPSFYDPASAAGVTEKPDRSGGWLRTEVLCSKCDAHLGHVFEGEGFDTPTDRRFCINGLALRYVPAAPPAPPPAEARPAGPPK
jgi:peptide-methionine (R)-S-oxide reductase